MISIEGVNQFYGSTQTLWDLDLEVAEGSITCIMGRNGVGKTTLLKCLMGLLPIKSGSLRVGDTDFARLPAVARPRSGVAYVPQGRDVFPLLTVEENLRIGLGSRRDKIREIPQQVFELFPVLNDMLSRRGGDLSGGQQQQLAIGRALVLDPQVLILDEPNEGIQPNIVRQIGDVVLKLNKEQGLTVILVEQKLAFARRVGQEFRLMEKGRVVASGNMDLLSDELVNRHLAV
ncbi:urea ABC transporter ATP-binding subunit UrtE [Halieaceae bacterium IMCC14734]|uniref:Urea ABC transporter ATP-binding subunit UrtE n=1 Tax=Candidatus Litorirhabdus singularis TaxID=2518993 RepID=A0ABT3TLR1_9GAMM|nr:urea ABC transporter ATP-binding subunit UrtE [Candidatus Litorirhabdus singularis]MCX2982277.1 urea ABC transporter ATP-binding subunit UrtE [Candidatus Litorirhabdus singularis]